MPYNARMTAYIVVITLVSPFPAAHYGRCTEHTGENNYQHHIGSNIGDLFMTCELKDNRCVVEVMMNTL
jgi:hypothetical protein